MSKNFIGNKHPKELRNFEKHGTEKQLRRLARREERKLAKVVRR